MTFELARAMIVSLPQVEERSSYGTPGFRVAGKLFARLREDGETLVVKADPFERDALVAAKPDVYFITDHYRGHDWVLVRLPAIEPDELRERLEQAWRHAAPRRVRAQLEGD